VLIASLHSNLLANVAVCVAMIAGRLTFRWVMAT
jgi:hypothetical protein